MANYWTSAALSVCLILIGSSNIVSGQGATIRLVNGTRPSQGRVEVKYTNQWGTVCDDDFDRNAATVVCRQLGFTGNLFVSRPQAYYGSGSGTIWLDDTICLGNETSLFNCRHSSLGVTNCGHDEDVGVDCNPGMDAQIPVRLVDGTSGRQGRVEVMYKGVWGTVCDDEWDDKAAMVVCKQKGFSSAIAIPLGNAYFGNSTSANIWLDDVKCTGQETGLGSCEHKPWGRTNCDHSEDAGVMCLDAGTPPNVQVQLTGGLSMFQGRVMINVYNQWGTICDDKFGVPEANVICRMLGHHRGGQVITSSSYSGGSGPIWLDDLECTGNETSIADCVHKPFGVNNCDHSEDVSVLCLQDNPPALQVRLADGQDSNRGRVEVKYNGQWGTVCDDRWSASDAAVVCRMLGKPFSGAVGVSHAAFGASTAPILMDNVECVGTETDIGQCRFAGWTINDCSHTEDAGVICQENTIHTQIRLVGGRAGQFEGRVEIQYNNSGTWGTICDDSFDTRDAAVICRMLNYPAQGAVAKGSAFFGPGTGQILLDDLDCKGNETDIALCGHRGWANTNCDHTEDVSVICNAQARQNTTVRLVGGATTSEGRVEVYHNGKWGTVCDDDFDTKSAGVVCKMLGLPSTGAQPRPKAYYGQGTGTIWLDNVHCTGKEANIDVCDRNTWGTNNCDHDEDVGVLCDTATNIRARLVNGSSTSYGRLEIFYNNTWGTVCDDGFNLRDAQVACRMLGFQTTNALPIAGAVYGSGTGPILLDDVSCLGSETDIAQCANKGWYNHNCQHSEDVGISCNSTAVRYRLANGTSNQNGRVEVYLNGQWGTVCDDNFDHNAATVVCKALNLPFRNAIALSGASFGQGTGQIWLDQTTCFGNETSLLLCNTNAPGDNDCTHSEDVGVICSDSQANGTVKYRLRGGPSNQEGRLEVFYAGRWGTVCDDNFDNNAALVVCNSLPNITSYVKAMVGASGKYGMGTGPIWLDDVTCIGNESELANCKHAAFGTNDCTHSEDVGVVCATSSQLSVNVRLRGGPVPRKGRVEVQHRSGGWGTVCDDGWGMAEATVVCNQLGYRGSIAVPLPSAYYGAGTGEIVLDNVNCNGSETNLGQCNHKPIGVNDCDHTEDAGVMCLQRGVGGVNVRLGGGLRSSEGRVEVQYQGVWGTVCDDSFNNASASVVCRQLGFTGGRALTGVGAGRGPIWMDDVKCTGSETSLASCPFSGWSINNCEHTEDVGVACDNSLAINYKARLMGGVTDHEGRVEVFYNNQWGTVCDDRWSDADAAVVCRMLGFSTDGARAIGGTAASAKYGQGTGSIYLDDVNCVGTESNLGQCTSNAAGLSNCLHSEDAGVVCQGGQVSSVNVRLVDGSDYNEGRVEIYYNNTWGTVCDDNWNAKSAQVVCSMLGFPGVRALPRMGGFFKNGNGTIWLDDVNCMGNETSLTMCGHRPWSTNNCGHTEDAGVVCGGPIRTSTIRLRGGSTIGEGRVEVFHNNTWGTICDDSTDHNFAVVVCRQLGFSTANVAVRSGAFFGPGSGPIWLDDMTCAGDETAIDNCVYRPWGTNNCGHNEDVSVLCTVPTAPIRLVPRSGGPNNQGRLEIFYNNTWGTVCDDSFNYKTAGVVCSMLGYPRAGAVSKGSAYFGQGSGPILLDDVTCTGSESNILECNTKPWGTNNCDHSEDVGVICGSSSITNVRLAGGDSYHGRVEIFHNGTWGTVCDDRFSNAAAQVVCRMLNLTQTNARVISMSSFSSTAPRQIWLDEVRCVGTEQNIDDCSHNPWGQNDCTHREDVAIACAYTTLPTFIPPASVTPNPIATNVNVRLVGGHAAYEGRVEVFYQGQWGTVCDDDWSAADAGVVCGMLGYSRNGATPFKTATYGAGSGQIWLDNVNCQGTEATIGACQANNWGTNNCDHNEDAGVSCSVAQLPDNFLIFTDSTNHSIYRMDLSTQSYVPIPLTRTDNPIAIDYDPVGGNIYWTDVGLKQIRMASIYGNSERTVRLLGNASVADGIAVDPISRLIFYTDTGYDVIAVLSMDTSSQAVVVNQGLDQPRAITLDVLQGKIYWSDWGSSPKISTALYDGTGVSDIITTRLKWPNAIALDAAGGRIFWADGGTDNIEVAFLDGSNRQLLQTDPSAHYFGLALYQNTLFFTNWHTSTVNQIQTDGVNMTAFGPPGFGRLNDIHVHTNSYGPKGTNLCTNGRGGCSHICIPKGNGITCLCPTGLSLNPDKVSCGRSIPCPAITPLTTGTISPANCTTAQSMPGATCSITCNSGYNPAGITGKSVTCFTNGLWNGQSAPVTCQDVTPPVIACPGNLVFNANKGQQTAVVSWPDVKVTDNSGLMPKVFQSMISGSTLTEGVYGVNILATDAAGLPASCSFTVTIKVKRCPMREVPQNGYILSGVCPNYYGAKCMLGCNTGYQLSDKTSNGQITCDVDANGAPTWTGTGLSCQAVVCSQLSLPQHASFIGCQAPYSYNSNCQQQCQSGYTRTQGTDFRRCMRDGTWSGQAIVCASDGSVAAQTGSNSQQSASGAASAASTVPVVVGVVIGVVLIVLIVGLIFVYLRRLQWRSTSASAPISMGNIQSTPSGWDNPNYSREEDI